MTTRSSDLMLAFAAAVRDRDVSTLAALIDWPASGVATYTSALHDIEPERRAEVAAAGRDSLRRATGTSPAEMDLPSWLLRLLRGDGPAYQVLADQEVEDARCRLMPGEPPTGLPADVLGMIGDLRAELARVVGGFRVTDDGGAAIDILVLDDPPRLAAHR